MSDESEWKDWDDEKVRDLDVRPILEAGGAPFPAIMQAVDRLEPGEALRLRTPFEPVPLYGVMGSRGYIRCPREVNGDGGEPFWEVLFYPVDGDGDDVDASDSAGDPESPDGPMELDVRGMEPPEPMERVLATLEGLRYDDVLMVRHHREPQLLYPILAERGFSHRAEEDEAGEWLVRIWRNR